MKLLAVVSLLAVACSGSPGGETPGTVTSASDPVCLAPDGAFYMSFKETSGDCGSITGLYFTTDADRVITPGGNSGLSCAKVKQNGCSPVSPNCVGGDDMVVEAFSVVLSDPTHGTGTMSITGAGCSSVYEVAVEGG